MPCELRTRLGSALLRRTWIRRFVHCGLTIVFQNGIIRLHEANCVPRFIPWWYNLMWKPVPTEIYQRRFRQFEKKRPRELQAALANLDRYLVALNQGAMPKQIQGGWLRPEPMDVVAITERGGGKREDGKNKGKGLVPIRMYAWPEIPAEILHLITIGDKRTQSEDIRFSEKFVRDRLKEQEESGTNN